LIDLPFLEKTSGEYKVSKTFTVYSEKTMAATSRVIIDRHKRFYFGTGSLDDAKKQLLLAPGSFLMRRRVDGTPDGVLDSATGFGVFASRSAFIEVNERFPAGQRRFSEVIDASTVVHPFLFFRTEIVGTVQETVRMVTDLVLAFMASLDDTMAHQPPVVHTLVENSRTLHMRVHVRTHELRGLEERSQFAALLRRCVGTERMPPELRRALYAAVDLCAAVAPHIPMPDSRWVPSVANTAAVRSVATDFIVVHDTTTARFQFPTVWRSSRFAVEKYDADIDAAGRPRIKPYARFDEFPIQVESSGMDGGKTEQMVRLVSTGGTAALLGPRVLLAMEHAARVGCTLYSDVTTKFIGVDQYPRVACTVDSVRRLATAVPTGDTFDGTPTYTATFNRYDTVFLDELETISWRIGELLTNPSTHAKGWGIVVALHALVSGAKRVVCADAHFGDLSRRLLEALVSDGQPILQRSFTQKNHTDRRAQFVFGYTQAGVQTAEVALALVVEQREQGRNVYMPCSNKTTMAVLTNELRRLRPDDTIIAVCGHRDEQSTELERSKIERIKSGEDLPHIFLYTSIYGVGNSYDHIWFHVCVSVVCAQTLSYEMMMQECHRIRKLVPIDVAEPNVYFVCDSGTHDYTNGGPWTCQRLGKSDEVDERTPKVSGRSVGAALAALALDPAGAPARQYVRVTREGKRHLFVRRPRPHVKTLTAALQQVTRPVMANHAGGDDDAAVELSECTTQFAGQERFVPFLAEFERRRYNKKVHCIAGLRRLLHEQGSHVFPDARRLVSDVIRKPKTTTDVPAPSLALTLQLCDVLSGSGPDTMRRMAYALATFGRPNGESWPCADATPDPSRAYSFDESQHGDVRNQRKFRMNCEMLDPAFQTHRECAEHRIRYRMLEHDHDHAGWVEPWVRRLHALECVRALGFSGPFDTLTAVVPNVSVELMEAIAKYKGSRRCGRCNGAVCATCRGSLLKQAQHVISEEFGVSLRSATRKRKNSDGDIEWRLFHPVFWPACGPTWRQFTYYTTFKLELSKGESPDVDRTTVERERLRQLSTAALQEEVRTKCQLSRNLSRRQMLERLLEWFENQQ
jgi:hypothetical protein